MERRGLAPWNFPVCVCVCSQRKGRKGLEDRKGKVEVCLEM